MEQMTGDNVKQVEQPATADAVVIPWQRRREIGRFKAYWKTVFHVISRMGNLSSEAQGEVLLADAREFRTSTIGMAFIALLFSYAMIFITLYYGASWRYLDPHMTWFGVVIVPIYVVLTCLMLLMQTGIVRWFFWPTQQEEPRRLKTLALSYYAVSPMALAVLVVLPFSAIVITMNLLNHHTGMSLIYIVVGVWGLLAVWWYAIVMVQACTVAKRNAGGVVLTAILLPLVWTVISLMVLLLPVGLVMWFLMVLSLA